MVRLVAYDEKPMIILYVVTFLLLMSHYNSICNFYYENGLLLLVPLKFGCVLRKTT